MKSLSWQISFFILTLFLFSELKAQEYNADKESRILYLFEKSRELAAENNYTLAAKNCKEILSLDSLNTDAAILLARIYSWNAQYDSAATIISEILEKHPSSYDALEAATDNEFAAGRYKSSIEYAKIAQKHFPDKEVFKSKEIRADLELKRGQKSNRIHIQFWSDFIEGNDPWLFGSFTYTKKFKKSGSLSLRYNYANRYQKSGHQFEADAYPILSKRIYLYLNAGLSNSINFPFLRAAVEPYIKLPAGFEASAGIRYMSFVKESLLSFKEGEVIILTGTIGKYSGNWWFSVRPYFSYSDNNWSTSATLTTRRYLSDPDSFISLNLGTGFSPDLQQYAYNPDLQYLKSNRLQLDYQQKFANWYIFNLGAGYAREEFQNNIAKNRFTLIAGLTFIL